MLTIALPNIAVQKVNNGWVVLWHIGTTTVQREPICKVALTDEELLAVIKEAAASQEKSP